MARRTKKIGIAGKFGARYGVKIRRRIKDIDSQRAVALNCPKCQHASLHRRDTGIWNCRHCDHTFAGGAYAPRVTTVDDKEE